MTPSGARFTPGTWFPLVAVVISAVSIAMPRAVPPREPDFSLDGWRPDPARLAEVMANERELMKRFPMDRRGEEALRALAAFSAVELKTGGSAESPEYLAATEEIVKVLTRYWFDRGEHAYRALGAFAARRFEAAIRAVLAAATRDGIGVESWVASRRDRPEVRALHAYGGNFLDNALDWGLIDQRNRLADPTGILLRLHFKLRWFRFVNDIQDYAFLMHPEELRALWRYRVEGDRSMSLQAKIEGPLRRLQKIDPDYPVYRVLGALFARRGEWRQAAAFYREALLDAPFDPTLQANLEYLVGRLGEQEQ